jgi:hypothetical protein
MIQPGDDDIQDLIWRPYDYEVFDAEEIRSRLNLLTPERGIVMFVSQIVEQQEKDLQTERWYGTKWTKAKMDDDFIAKLRTIVPGPDERLGYPPVNKYIP